MKDYTNYSYQALVNKMTNLLKDKEGWGDGYDSSVGQTLIQLMADVTDNLHYMLERRTRESYLETATLRSSIITRACELGYRYRRVTANKGTLRITLPQPAVGDILIPRGTTFTRNSIPYTVMESVSILNGETYADVLVVQGNFETILRELDESGVFTIADYELIENDSFRIFTSDGEYLDVVTQDNVNYRALSFLGKDAQFYDIKYSAAGMCVVFGDNITGKRPTGLITASYITVDGTYSPILELGLTFDTTAGDTINTLGATVTNISRISGGLPPESIEDVKKNAVVYHKSNGRATTNDDYAMWATSFPGTNIVDVLAYGEEEIKSVIYNTNNVYINYLKDDGGELTQAEHIALRQYLNNVKTSQAHLVIRPVDKFSVAVNCDAKKAPNVPMTDSEMYDILRNFFVSYFSFKKGSIGREYQSSDIVNELYKLRVNRNGISYPVIDFVRVILNGLINIPVSPSVSSARVSLDKNAVYSPGDLFAISIDGVPVTSTIQAGEGNLDIMYAMREEVISQAKLNADVEIMDIVFGYDDRYTPIVASKTGTVTTVSGDNDFTTIRLTTNSNITVEQFFYGRAAGQKPLFPFFNGTDISFTAPAGSNIRVLTYDSVGGVEVEHAVVLAGQPYSHTFLSDGFARLEFISSVNTDVILQIVYGDLFSYDLAVSTFGDNSTFTIDSNIGDLAAYTQTYFTFTIPHRSTDGLEENSVGSVETDICLRGSFRIYDGAYNILYTDDSAGGFVDSMGVVNPNLSIDYKTGALTVMASELVDQRVVMFSHNEYDNIDVDITDVVEMIEPNVSFGDTSENYSKIRII